MYEHQRRPPVDPWMDTFRKFPRKLRLMFACVLPCVSVRPRASISVLAMSGSAEEHMGTSLPARCKRKAAPVFDVWEYFDKAEADGTLASEFNEITKQHVSFGRRIARLHSGSPRSGAEESTSKDFASLFLVCFLPLIIPAMQSSDTARHQESLPH